jgi:CubicO group peptidase (beta-lactamase class C family)
MKALRRGALGLLLLVVIVLAVLSSHPPALLRVGANYAAKIVCSNVFLAHRDPKDVLETDVQAPGVGVMKLLHVSVDGASHTVRAGFLGFIGDGLAVYRPGAGCAALPDGKLPLKPLGVIPSANAEVASTAPPGGAADYFDRAVPIPALQAVVDDDALVGPGIRAALIIDHGRIVAERYAPGFGAETPLLGWSMSKTVTAALVGILVKDGKLSLEQSGFWPKGDGREAIKLTDLMSMSSGLHFNETYGAVSDVTRMLYLEPDVAGFAHAQPLEHPIGTVWSYSSGTANIVARIVQDAGGGPQFVEQRLFQPLGMKGAVMETDEYGTLVGSSYMYATARDWGRFGELLVEDGTLHGERLLPEGFVAEMARPLAASQGQYGHGFVWLWGSDPVTPGHNPDTAFGIPGDTFYLSGHDGQTVAVVRSRGLVVVRLGLTPSGLGYTPQKLLEAALKAQPATT